MFAVNSGNAGVLARKDGGRGRPRSQTSLTATWTVDEEVALIHDGVIDKVTVASVSGNDATISGTITSATDGADVTVIFPYSAVDQTTGENYGKVKADLLYAQSGGTLADIAAKYDVRKGNGTLKVSGTASLNDDVTLTNQFAIFKFTTKSVSGENGSLQNTNVTKLTVTTGGQDYVITPSGATSSLYAALPAVSGQAVSFTATDGSNLYAASKASVSFDAAKYYQSTVKMGKVIEVFYYDEPFFDDFVGLHPNFHYLHIGLDQAYAIAKQLSTQNGGALRLPGGSPSSRRRPKVLETPSKGAFRRGFEKISWSKGAFRRRKKFFGLIKGYNYSSFASRVFNLMYPVFVSFSSMISFS